MPHLKQNITPRNIMHLNQQLKLELIEELFDTVFGEGHDVLENVVGFVEVCGGFGGAPDTGFYHVGLEAADCALSEVAWQLRHYCAATAIS